MSTRLQCLDKELSLQPEYRPQGVFHPLLVEQYPVSTQFNTLQSTLPRRGLCAVRKMSRSEQTLKRDYSSFLFIRQDTSITRLFLIQRRQRRKRRQNRQRRNSFPGLETLTVSRSSFPRIPWYCSLGGVIGSMFIIPPHASHSSWHVNWYSYRQGRTA